MPSFYLFLNVFFFHFIYIAPSGPPLNFRSVDADTVYIVLMWDVSVKSPINFFCFQQILMMLYV